MPEALGNPMSCTKNHLQQTWGVERPIVRPAGSRKTNTAHALVTGLTGTTPFQGESFPAEGQG